MPDHAPATGRKWFKTRMLPTVVKCCAATRSRCQASLIPKLISGSRRPRRCARWPNHWDIDA